MRGRGTPASQVEGVRTRKWKKISPDLETDLSGSTGHRAESQTSQLKPPAAGPLGLGWAWVWAAAVTDDLYLLTHQGLPHWADATHSPSLSSPSCGVSPGAHTVLQTWRGFCHEVPAYKPLTTSCGGLGLQRLSPELMDFLSQLPRAHSM